MRGVNKPVTLRDLGLVGLSALSFSVATPVAKMVVGLSPVGVAAGRTFVACVAVSVLARRDLFGSLRALGPRARWGLVGAGFLLSVHFALFLGGLALTSLPAAAALVSLEPLAVVLVAWASFGLRPTPREALGVLFATGGGLLVAQGAGSGEHRLVGDLVVLAAVLVYGGYVAAARALRDALPVLPYAAATYGVATLFLLPFAVALGVQEGPPPPSAWLAVLILGLVPTLIGHTLVQRAARTVPPAIVGLVSPGETIGSLALGALLLGARPRPIEAAGTALILVGATLAVSGARRPAS